MKVLKIFSVLIFMLSVAYAQTSQVSMDNARLVPKLLNYQGYLTDTTDVPIDGALDMTFKIFDAASSGNELWSEAQTNVPVERGVFSVILGSGTTIPDSVFADFTGTWLELTLEGPQILTPRTRITSVGYAYTSTYSDTAEYANNAAADNDWTLSSSRLYPSGNYGLSMRSGNVLHGTNDSTHVNFGVACTTGASGLDYVYCTVGGGSRNVASGDYSTVGGGRQNIASYQCATVCGGYQNTVNYPYSVIAGGYHNSTSGDYAYVGGGYVNAASNGYTVVVGGNQNNAAGFYAVVGSGYADTVQGNYGFCGSGYLNKIGDAVDDSGAVVISGRQNSSLGKYSFIGTGYSNSAGGDFAVITGGNKNNASGHYATIGAGFSNSVVSNYGTVTGGLQNAVNAEYGVVAGGYADSVGGVYGFIGSGYSNRAGDNTNDSCVVVVSGYGCAADSKYCYVGTGRSNQALEPYDVCVGGRDNTVSGGLNFIGCGESNNISDNGVYGAIVGGNSNSIRSFKSFIGGGENNHITINAHYATIAGGVENYIGGTAQYCAIPGGVGDTCMADWYGFAANGGSYVTSLCDNSAVFNGQTSTTVGQLRCGVISKIAGSFTIDHPIDPSNKILNHYFAESPEMINIYRGVAVLDENGYAEIELPEYFDALNRTPMIQLTGVGTSDVFVAQKVQGNSFAIGGKSGTEVYWTVTGDRKDPGAEITRILMPVEQAKDGELSGRSLDDDFYAATKPELMRLGKDNGFEFRTARGQAKYEKLEELKRKTMSD